MRTFIQYTHNAYNFSEYQATNIPYPTRMCFAATLELIINKKNSIYLKTKKNVTCNTTVSYKQYIYTSHFKEKNYYWWHK